MTIEGAARSNHPALTADFKLRRTRFWWSASYTWSKAIDDTDDIFPLTRAQDQTNFGAERGLSLFDQRHRVVSSLNWQTHVSDEAWGKIIGNWNLSGIVEVASGRPYNVILGYDNNLDQFSSSDRPDIILDSSMVRYLAPAQGRPEISDAMR